MFGIDDNVKKINHAEFKKALRELSDISDKERNYLEEVFKNDLSDGLTQSELRRRIEQLSHNYSDELDYWEVEHVKKKLLGELDKK